MIGLQAYVAAVAESRDARGELTVMIDAATLAEARVIAAWDRIADGKVLWLHHVTFCMRARRQVAVADSRTGQARDRGDVLAAADDSSSPARELAHRNQGCSTSSPPACCPTACHRRPALRTGCTSWRSLSSCSWECTDCSTCSARYSRSHPGSTPSWGPTASSKSLQDRRVVTVTTSGGHGRSNAGSRSRPPHWPYMGTRQRSLGWHWE